MNTWIHECDKETETSLLCREYNNVFDQFCRQGTLPITPLESVEMFHILRRQLVKMQLVHWLSRIGPDKTEPCRVLVLGVGRDDMFLRLGQNPGFHITCVDKDEVVQEVLADYGTSNIPSTVHYVGLDIESEIKTVVQLVYQHHLIVCEGILIYLSAAVVNAIFDATERAGGIVMFNLSNAALKSFNPKLFQTSIEDAEFGNLREVARVSMDKLGYDAGFGETSTDVQTWLITLVSSNCVYASD
ncbi:hypothetical protein C2W62_25560 [Candidatus Entotheonella serta]|nr:hypothetical protein C2W62_25560 [Candidatus Entotheonella serta]